METVSVGCRLPNGYVLEVGFSVNQPARGGGAPFAMYTKHEDYATFTLRGTNQHLIIRDASRKPIGTLPNQANREPYINENVPKALWDRWVKENPKNWALKSGQIFLIPSKDAATAKAAGLDAKAKSKNILEPVDPTATMKIENHAITRRSDDE